MKRKFKNILLSFFCALVSMLFLGAVIFWPVPEKVAQGEPASALPVLIYHSIHLNPFTPAGPTAISYRQFSDEMRYLYDQGYKTLSVDEVVAFLQGKKFPPKVVAITIDDGLLSSLYAVPVLFHYGFKASYWIIPSLAQPNPAAPGADRLYMSWQTLSLLNKIPGMELYSHTLTHPWDKGDRLTDWVSGGTPGKTEKDALFELTESKRLMEAHLEHPVPYLCWPSGVYEDTLVHLAKKAGYTALFTTRDGLNHPGDNMLHIRRIVISGKCDTATFADILSDGKYRGC